MSKTVSIIVIGCLSLFSLLQASDLKDNQSTSLQSAQTYYFSSIRGNDNNTGTRPDSPWGSISKLNQLINTLKAGDIVYFEKGSSWDNVDLDLSGLYGSFDNPIVFTSYGTGAKPRLKGSKLIESFSQQGAVWKCVDTALPEYNSSGKHLVPFIFIDEARYETSRYPDMGYLSTNTLGTDSYLLDNSQSWATNQWKNGLAVVRTQSWKWYTRRISQNTSNSLTFDPFGVNYERENTSYIIRNHVNACNLNGEWAQQNDTLWIYHTLNLNTRKVEVPVIDVIINITNCRYIQFVDLQIERSVMYNVTINNSWVTFKNCVLTDAGSYLISGTNHSSINITDSDLSYGRRGGISLKNCQGNIIGNNFSHLAFDGADNDEGEVYGACVQNWYCEGLTKIDANSFNDINIAYHGHYSNADNYVTRNVISNFGMTIKDAAAIYYGTDFTPYNKIVSRNFIHNAHNDFVHGIYIDSNSNNVKADSNTISNTNIAFYIHVSRNNTISNNKIVNPAKDMKFPWNSAIRLDEYSFNHGNEGSAVTGNSVNGNTIVLGNTTNELALAFLNLSNLTTNSFNNNKYFNPFGSHQKLFVNGDNYSEYRTYTLGEWRDFTGLESNSSYNQTNWTYSSVSSLGIKKEDFVLLLTNPTTNEKIVDLKEYGATYFDINGNEVSDQAIIPAYDSKILFYHSTDLSMNHKPIMSDQVFTIRLYEEPLDALIGKIIATDLDADQSLKFSIVSGNDEGLFRITTTTGDLFLTTADKNLLTQDQYLINVLVTDNGEPALSETSTITIKIITANSIPNAPTSFATSSVGYTSVDLFWLDESNNEDGFEILRTGPDNSGATKIITLDPNQTVYTDIDLQINSSYQYKIRAYNALGYSPYANTIGIKTLYTTVPNAPTNLQSVDYTHSSISLSWKDNSTNEENFVITRSLVADPNNSIDIIVNANDTSFIDYDVSTGTTYVYSVKAVNGAGHSPYSNQNIVATLSMAENKRIRDGLIAYYNFSFNPELVIYDLSGYESPLNLRVLQPSRVQWESTNELNILSGTSLVSFYPATKITKALKETNEITFECWIKPVESDFPGKTRIISLGKDNSDLGFALDQDIINQDEEKSLYYSVRLQTGATGTSGYPELIQNKTESYINMQHVAYVRDSIGTESIYINGKKSSEGFRPNDFGLWKDNYYLRLGNESDLNHPWKGGYYVVAIYNIALSEDQIEDNYTAGPRDNLVNKGMSYNMKLYPNPVTGNATIEINPEQIHDIIPKTSIRIIDMYGTVLYQESMFDPTRQYIKSYDFQDFPSGIYFLQVMSGDVQKSVRIVRQ